MTDIKELERIKSHECHLSTHELKKYGFNYHEMMGMAAISVFELGKFESDFKSFKVTPMSRDEFIDWCNEYEKRDGIIVGGST
jgi:hypothetical protein